VNEICASVLRTSAGLIYHKLSGENDSFADRLFICR